MKRLLPVALFVCLLPVSSKAGETNGPGAVATPTPICVENCTNSTTTSDPTTSTLLPAEILIGILLIALTTKV